MLRLAIFKNSHLVVLDLFINSNGNFNMKEVSKNTSLGYNAVRKAMQDLADMGYIRKIDAGRYIYNDLWNRCAILKELVFSPDFSKPKPAPKPSKGVYLPNKMDEENGYNSNILDLT